MSRFHEIKRFFDQELRRRFPELEFQAYATGSSESEIMVYVEVDRDRAEYHRLADELAQRASTLYQADVTSIVYTQRTLEGSESFTAEFVGSNDALLVTYLPHRFTVPVYLPTFLENVRGHEDDADFVWDLVFARAYVEKAKKLGFFAKMATSTSKKELCALMGRWLPTLQQVLEEQHQARV